MVAPWTLIVVFVDRDTSGKRLWVTNYALTALRGYILPQEIWAWSDGWMPFLQPSQIVRPGRRLIGGETT